MTRCRSQHSWSLTSRTDPLREQRLHKPDRIVPSFAFLWSSALNPAGCFRIWVSKVIHCVTFRSWVNSQWEYGPNPQYLHEDKMNFLEASGAQRTQEWGVRDGKPSFGINCIAVL